MDRPHGHATVIPAPGSAGERQLWRWLARLGLPAVLLLVVMAIAPLRRSLRGLDDVWYRWMVQWQWPPLVAVARVFAAAGSVWLLLPARVIVAGWLAWRRQWQWVTVWISSIVVSEVAIGLLKTAYGRPRPPASLEVTTSPSFPSGHAVAGAVTAVVVVALITRPGKRRWHWWLAGLAFSGGMALSRTYLRAHWLTDVVAGTLVGACVGLTCLAVVTTIAARRRSDT